MIQKKIPAILCGKLHIAAIQQFQRWIRIRKKKMADTDLAGKKTPDLDPQP